ncbi:bifunctional 4-hydroxy-2-oxoglutarate aldolase/2-dehydro-3-deoxy-phosphogluconate aldolase [Pandoraea sputorum]|uniref:2-dehydro-3-deoxy-phosphogluconate aldolase n=1 Tax=Pandoraea sputorum TaxID=93222 RepID=A0A239SA62_9BURK|nr:bifunctional 4-hydroxy-2-oxoglutarate aldolase/2-dehydro-3-deoxy-phosphogluconate aldolase [Pandoraea sputorum]AJC16148.1 2-dehydro-3-deoxyphosphogluconate aldolase [Pandoraea sputorum]SNU82307.1 KHG/KDPG aldolase [Pandoraea sputorum]VVE46166.1 2-dehydro-3-deoxyphosphogluconate aldolase [Pandoraea sputorum]VVE76772.1 2-dehydro-3-deoxyphosphogluconate aldolase [Pandoraea sputorum]VVE82206.1 2-dehydro-3-deoxyphosphogluconate aldolase [Pandoraea sputorum]
MNINDIVRAGPVVPVLQFDNVEQGEQVSRALLAGGVRVLEITLRTPAAMDVIRHVAGLSDELIVGVGTLTRPEEMAQAVAAGARFGVSPGYTPALGAAAKAAGLPLLPGVVTPSDILTALADGYETVKFFPAEPSGGVPMLKALYGPFRDVRFCPTGGISAESAPSYLAQPNVVCVGGSWLTPKALVDAKDWDGITRLARAASALPRA